MIIILFLLIGIGVFASNVTEQVFKYPHFPQVMKFQPKLYTTAVHRIKGYFETYEGDKRNVLTGMEAKINSVVSAYDIDNQTILMQYRIVDLLDNHPYGGDSGYMNKVFSLEKGFDGSIIDNSLMKTIQNTSSLVMLLSKVAPADIGKLLMVRLYSALTTGYIVFPSHPLALNESWSPPSFELSFVNDFLEGTVDLKVDRTFTLKKPSDITGTTTIVVKSDMPSKGYGHSKQTLKITIDHEWTLDSSTIVVESKHVLKGTFTDYNENNEGDKVDLVGECITELLDLSEPDEEAAKMVEKVSAYLLDADATDATPEEDKTCDTADEEDEVAKDVEDQVPMLESVTRHYWDSSCDCPRPGRMYTHVFFLGFQVMMYYNETTYDVRTRHESVMICPPGQAKDRLRAQKEEERIVRESKKKEVSDDVINYLKNNSTNSGDFSWQASVVRMDNVLYSNSSLDCPAGILLRSTNTSHSEYDWWKAYIDDGYRMIVNGNNVVYDLRISGERILMCPWNTMTFAPEPIVY